MLLIKNIGRLVTQDNNLQDINNAAVLINKNNIYWVGPEANLPLHQAGQIIDANSCVVIPGLIDCHTHMMFTGSRHDEFARRMQGESYERIMNQGGGIVSTVRACGETNDHDLLTQACTRAAQALKLGITTIEIKSGYGLSIDAELRLLRLIKKLANLTPITIHPTFMGAHVIPPEYLSTPSEYINQIIHEMLPQVALEKLAIDCDVFCEVGAFSLRDAKQILTTAHDLGLGLRAHVQQLGPSGGVKLVEDLPIKSVSHADFLSPQDISLLASKNIPVELLPIAALFLRSKNITPVDKLTHAGVKLTIATDFNPGTAMSNDLITAARLGVTYFGCNIQQALSAITKHAALALGRNNIGQISPDYQADLVITNCHSVEEIFYDWTKHPVSQVIKHGELVV